MNKIKTLKIDHLKNKRILVTGGTGSFGNFIVAKLLETPDIKEIVVFSRDEKKQFDMQNRYLKEKRIKFIVGNIRDKESVREAMSGINLVFHAAALKQVPSCEKNPFEAVKTNILGAQNVIRAAIENGVTKVICISTDKAVKPVNVMGMTKSIQERLAIKANLLTSNKNTVVCCVRYGNVVSSRGSILPLFREQLRAGLPLTITDKNMTRFLLTLGDAIDLVLFAAQNTKGGEIFVKKAPSAKIMDLAETICNETQKSFNYKIIGSFPGEKIHEILVTEEELTRTEDLGGYFKIHPWWNNPKFSHISKEYCSKDKPANQKILKNLISKADNELKNLNLYNGIFSKM